MRIPWMNSPDDREPKPTVPWGDERKEFDETAIERASRATSASCPDWKRAFAPEPVSAPSRLARAEELHGLEDIVPHHVEVGEKVERAARVDHDGPAPVYLRRGPGGHLLGRQGMDGEAEDAAEAAEAEKAAADEAAE